LYAANDIGILREDLFQAKRGVTHLNNILCPAKICHAKCAALIIVVLEKATGQASHKYQGHH